MIEPVNLENFFVAFFSAAMVISMGATYALFYAAAKIYHRKAYLITGYLSYVALVVSVYYLADALNLHGYWQVITWVMLIGYLFAPHGIWHLCRGTHAQLPGGKQF